MLSALFALLHQYESITVFIVLVQNTEQQQNKARPMAFGVESFRACLAVQTHSQAPFSSLAEPGNFERADLHTPAVYLKINKINSFYGVL